MSVDANLQRRDSLGALQPWVLVDDAENAATGLSDPTVDLGVRQRLDSVLAELETTGDAVGSTADAESLATVVGRLKRIVTLLSGPLAVNVANPEGLTDAELRAAPVDVADGHPDPQTDALTDTELRAAPVEVTGTVVVDDVEVNNFPAAYPLPAGQVSTLTPQTNGLTDTQLRAAPVPVLGPLTDTQLRASAVPVSGPLTDGQLRAASVSVTATNPTETGLAKEATLGSILTELTQKLEAGQAVALNQQALDAILTPTDVQLQVNGQDISGLNPLPVTSTFANADGVPYDANNRVPVDVGANITIDNLTVSYESVISTANSPAGPLAANETFVGSWEDVRDYAAIQAAIWTDVASATNGAIVDFSADGTNIVRSVGTTIAANFQAYFSLAPEARYVRFRYINGPAAQTFVRFQIKYAFNAPAEVQQPIGATITDANIATVGRSTVAARVYSGGATGMHVPLQANTSGHLSVRVENQIPAIETGLATQTTLAAVLAELGQKLEAGQAVALDAGTLAALETISIANLPAVQPVNDNGGSITVDGSVNVDNFPASQPVTGPLTDTQLRATAVPVSGSVTATGPLTDTQLRLTPVPISGTITANLGTIDGAATETTLAALLVELGQKLEPGGQVALDAATLAALETITVANMIPAVETGLATQTTLASVLAKLASGIALDAPTLAALENTSVTVTGSALPAGAATEASLAALAADVANGVTVNQPVAVTDNGSSLTVDGTVAVSGTVSVSGPLTDAQLRASAVPVSGALTDTQLRAAPLPVSGTITANLGTIDGAATETSLVSLLAEFRNKYDVVSTAKATYTSSGDHTLITPPAGQSLRVVWIFVQAKAVLDTGVVLVSATLGPNSYEFELTGSQPFAHGAVWEGAVDQVLTITTSSTAAVLVNVDYRVY